VTELVSQLQNCSGSVVSCCCEKLVAKACDSSGTHRKKDARRWKPLLSKTSEDVTDNEGYLLSVPLLMPENQNSEAIRDGRC
jgi:hypothetical protein